MRMKRIPLKRSQRRKPTVWVDDTRARLPVPDVMNRPGGAGPYVRRKARW